MEEYLGLPHTEDYICMFVPEDYATRKRLCEVAVAHVTPFIGQEKSYIWGIEISQNFHDYQIGNQLSLK